MYLAVFLAAVILVTFLYRQLFYDTSDWEHHPGRQATAEDPGQKPTKRWVQKGLKYWDCLKGGKDMYSMSTWWQVLFSPEGLLTIVIFACTVSDVGVAFLFLSDHDWLAPSGVFPAHHNETKELLASDEWQLPGYIRWISITVPIVMLATCVIVVYHILGHYSKVKELNRKDETEYDMSEYRDKSIQVVLLPMVYSIMAFKSVLRMWKCFMNDFGHTGKIHMGLDPTLGANFSANVHIQMEIYETNYRTADLYEAWALYCFGRLTLKFLMLSVRRVHTDVTVTIDDKGSVQVTGAVAGEPKKQVGKWDWTSKRGVKWLDKAKAWKVDTVERAAELLHTHKDQVTKYAESGKPMAAYDHVIEDPGQLSRVDGLVKVLRDVTVVGVQAFVFCAVVTAFVAFYKPIMDMLNNAETAISIAPNSFSTMHVRTQLMNPTPYLDGFMDGLGFFGSSIAIYNLLKIETSPDLHDFLEKFHPFWKFWGTKILVSIAYTQGLVLSGVNFFFNLYSEQQINVIYSTLIVYELFGIALLHYLPVFHAWHPDGKWLQRVEAWERDYREECEEEFPKTGDTYGTSA